MKVQNIYIKPHSKTEKYLQQTIFETVYVDENKIKICVKDSPMYCHFGCQNSWRKLHWVTVSENVIGGRIDMMIAKNNFSF